MDSGATFADGGFPPCLFHWSSEGLEVKGVILSRCSSSISSDSSRESCIIRPRLVCAFRTRLARATGDSLDEISHREDA